MGRSSLGSLTPWSPLLMSVLIVLSSFPSDISTSSSSAKKSSNIGEALGERISSLIEQSLRKPLIRMNGDKFRNFVGKNSFPRNYSMVIMMTALSGQRGCQICRQASDEFTIVANSYWRQVLMGTNGGVVQMSPPITPTPSNSRLFFGLIDYDEGSDVFQSLNINSAPVFLFFDYSKTTGGKLSKKLLNGDQMDIQRIGFGAETIARWIQEKDPEVGVIKVIRPPNYSGSFALLILFSMISALLYMRRNNLDFLFNRTSWALGALSIVFAMTSGQMWNHIRGPPIMHRTQKGGVSYIHGSSSGQFVIETYIIIVLNASIAMGMILMNEAMRGSSKGSNDPKKRKIMAMFGMGLTAVFFSLLLSVFRSKAHGYPYSFLFK